MKCMMLMMHVYPYRCFSRNAPSRDSKTSCKFSPEKFNSCAGRSGHGALYSCGPPFHRRPLHPTTSLLASPAENALLMSGSSWPHDNFEPHLSYTRYYNLISPLLIMVTIHLFLYTQTCPHI